MTILLQLVAVFAMISLISVGGANATIPEIFRQVVSVHHWIDPATFAQLVAIGQTAPGPNVLVASMIGWHLAGVAGLLAVTVAIVVPSSAVAFAIGRICRAHKANAWIRIVRAAFAPIAVGFMLASGIIMTRAAYHGLMSIVIAGSVAAMVVLSRRSPLWGIAGGAAAGLVSGRLHLMI